MRTLTVAKVIILNAEGEILLLRRSKDDIRRPLQWDVPGGHTDGDEFPAEAAARETYEETGITIGARELRLVYAMTEAVDEDLSVTWLFHLARIDTAEVRVSSEHEEYVWASLEQAMGKLDYARQKRVLEYIKLHDLLTG